MDNNQGLQGKTSLNGSASIPTGEALRELKEELARNTSKCHNAFTRFNFVANQAPAHDILLQELARGLRDLTLAVNVLHTDLRKFQSEAQVADTHLEQRLVSLDKDVDTLLRHLT